MRSLRFGLELVQDPSTFEGALEILAELVGGISEPLQEELARVASNDHDVFFFLTRNLHLLQKDPDTTLQQLLQVYKLQKQPSAILPYSSKFSKSDRSYRS